MLGVAALVAPDVTFAGAVFAGVVFAGAVFSGVVAAFVADAGAGAAFAVVVDLVAVVSAAWAGAVCVVASFFCVSGFDIPWRWLPRRNSFLSDL